MSRFNPGIVGPKGDKSHRSGSVLLRQLRSLEAQNQSGGSNDIRPSHGQKDDVAAVALAALELSKRPKMREPFVEVFFVGRA